MGWAHCGTDSTGREIGYGIEATCDHPGCTAEIDRGLGYACGGMHGEDEWYCEKYFCAAHQHIHQFCPSCYARYLALVCQEWECASHATGTLVEADGDRTRLCEAHGKACAAEGEGDQFIPDHPARIAKINDAWELTDGWSDVRTARDAGEARIIATDRATGAAVWLVFTEGEEFQVEPV